MCGDAGVVAARSGGLSPRHFDRDTRPALWRRWPPQRSRPEPCGPSLCCRPTIALPQKRPATSRSRRCLPRVVISRHFGRGDERQPGIAAGPQEGDACQYDRGDGTWDHRSPLSRRKLPVSVQRFSEDHAQSKTNSMKDHARSNADGRTADTFGYSLAKTITPFAGRVKATEAAKPSRGSRQAETEPPLPIALALGKWS
jgi:hypothetical protein